jgi:hypothetical protein
MAQARAIQQDRRPGSGLVAGQLLPQPKGEEGREQRHQRPGEGEAGVNRKILEEPEAEFDVEQLQQIGDKRKTQLAGKDDIGGILEPAEPIFRRQPRPGLHRVRDVLLPYFDAHPAPVVVGDHEPHVYVDGQKQYPVAELGGQPGERQAKIKAAHG